MKGFKELDVLENTDNSVKERLAEEFPPQDRNEKERVFNMSERKYNIRKNSADDSFVGEDEVKGVEIYKRPKWKIFATVAACAAIVAGIGGGGYMLKQLRSSLPDTVMSEMKDETTAPFGDFTAYDYFIPDLTSEKTELTVKEMGNTSMTFYSGEVIPFEKRQKIAEFFNSQEWKEAEPDPRDEGGREIEWTDEEWEKNIILFQSVTDSEMRQISIESENRLAYTIFEVNEEEGSLVCDKYYTFVYDIDFELFKSAIDGILNDSGKEQQQDKAPFGDFSELEYYIPINDTENAERIIINDDPSFYGYFDLVAGTPIEQDKRDRLAEFFNSYTWETYTPLGADSEPVQKSVEEVPSFDPYKENIVFLYRDDNEVRMIQISRDGVLGYTHFNYVNKDGQLCKDPTGGDIPCELYKVNYEFFKDTIDNILYGVGNVPPMQCDELEVIVKTFEKYDFYLQENTSNDGGINIVLPEGERFSILCGNTLSADKKDKIDTIIKNASWTDSPTSGSEENNAADSEYYTEHFGFVNITGNDIIAMDISSNHVEMCIYECSYDNGLYYVNEQKTYDIYTDSPTFMTDVYNVLFSEDEASSDMTAE